jgi:hypothetical protein
MAKRGRRAAATATEFKPPTPAERLQHSVDFAVQDAVRMHPVVKKIESRIRSKMMAAAQPGKGSRSGGIRNVRSA